MVGFVIPEIFLNESSPSGLFSTITVSAFYSLSSLNLLPSPFTTKCDNKYKFLNEKQKFVHESKDDCFHKCTIEEWMKKCGCLPRMKVVFRKDDIQNSHKCYAHPFGEFCQS